jgi:hypothetical protein
MAFRVGVQQATDHLRVRNLRTGGVAFKKSTLRLLRDMVIFTLSSRSTSRSGGGRKSLTTSRRPRGSSPYFRLRFINPLASAPIAGIENSNYVTAVRETHGQHATANLSETIEPWLAFAVIEIPSDHTRRIQECRLRVRKRHAVLTLVQRVLGRVPLEAWARRQKYG